VMLLRAWLCWRHEQTCQLMLSCSCYKVGVVITWGGGVGVVLQIQGGGGRCCQGLGGGVIVHIRQGGAVVRGMASGWLCT
jgi:hypothetical protein